MLYLALLGSPEIKLNGTPLHFSTAKAQALIYYLALQKRAQSRTQLAGLLWGGLPEAAARRNLRVELNRICAQLDPYFVRSRTEIGFDQHRDFWLDTDQISILTKRLDQVSPATMEEAVQLYRNDFLTGLILRDAPEFETWLAGEREQYKQKLIQIIRFLMDQFDLESQPQKALTYAQRWLALEPWNEEVHRRTMCYFVSLGEKTAALAQFQACEVALKQHLNLPPSPETQKLLQQIKTGREIPLSSTEKHIFAKPSLPISHPNQKKEATIALVKNRFIGRQQELSQLGSLLSQSGCRLITVTGPGGIGKTRLAIESGNQAVGLFPDGLFFIPLGAISDPNRLDTSLATALPFSLNGLENIQVQLVNFLREKHSLLILDNFEHLVANTDLILEILEQTEQVKILVTSRIALGVAEESVLSLAGLSLPLERDVQDSKDHKEEALSVSLFIDRAQQAHLQFTPQEEMTHIHRICRLVEGFPLGIELSAAWVRVISCAEIANEIAQSLDFLQTKADIFPLRQQKLRAVFDYSWAMLSDEAQWVFQRCSLFQGGFTRKAAQEIAGASLRTLSLLVDHCFLQRQPNGRYQAHELLRQFAAETASSAMQKDIQAQMSLHFAKVLDSSRGEIMRAAEQTVLETVLVDLANIQQSWLWAVEQLQFTLVTDYLPVLTQFYLRKGLYQEGQALFDNALEKLTTTSDMMAQNVGTLLAINRIRIKAAQMALALGQFDQVKYAMIRTIPFFESQQNQADLAEALTWLGYAEARTAEYDRAAAHLEEGLALYQALKDDVGIVNVFTGLGIVANYQANYAEAAELCQACLVIYQNLGYKRGIANTLGNLGTTQARQGNIGQAQAFYEQALSVAKQVGETQLHAVLLSNLGSCYRENGAYDQAYQYLHSSLEMFQQIGDQRWIVATQNILGLTLVTTQKLEKAKTYLRPALQLAATIQAIPDILDNLPILSRVLIGEGKLDVAQQILSYVAQHPLTRDAAQNVTAEAQTMLSQQIEFGQLQQATSYADYPLESIVELALQATKSI
ncbi:MAG: tetratricopeptide repeat protein [Chloroflexota bacterium]